MQQELSVFVQNIVDVLTAGVDLHDAADDVIDLRLKVYDLCCQFLNGIVIFLHICFNLRQLRQHIRHLALAEDAAAIATDIPVLTVVVPVTLCERFSTGIQAHRIHQQTNMVCVLRDRRK